MGNDGKNNRTITIIAHIMGWGNQMEEIDIVLEVDGKKIPMNDFVKKILCGMIKGSIETLHSVGGDWKTVNIKLNR